jgi:spore maturation protein CgeB
VPIKNKIKIFLVSDPTQFALTDLYHGYQKALQKLEIPHDSYPFHAICYSMAHSTALIKSNEFTHIMFIGGLNIPDFLLESFYNIKTIVVSSEDPHCFDPMKEKLTKIDYYFTNERSIANSGRYKNVYYCPTAACDIECQKMPKERLDSKYHSDLVFIGAMYPNRRKILEDIVPFIKENNINLKLGGHMNYMPKSSPLWEYVVKNETIPHNETVDYYNGAKIVINMMRDIKWNPKTKSQKNSNNRSRFVGESLNPRAYEVGMCQAFQLLEDTRSEARDVFTEDEVGFFADSNTLQSQIERYLADDKLREDSAFNSYKKVALKHSYTHRLKSILEVIQKDL